MQESIIRYRGIASGIYEEMEFFDNEFYLEPSPDNKEPSPDNKESSRK